MVRKICCSVLLLVCFVVGELFATETNKGAGRKKATADKNSSGFCLKKVTLTGAFTQDNDFTLFNFLFGLNWQTGEQRLYTHGWFHNLDGYSTWQLLGKLDLIGLSGKVFYPYLLLGFDMYTDYPGQASEEAFRILSGVGVNLNLFEKEPISFFFATSLDYTREIERNLPANILWWRSKAELRLRLFKQLGFNGSAVVSLPIGTNVEEWYDVVLSLRYRLSRRISLVGSLHFFDHKVFESASDGRYHTLRFEVNL